MDESNNLKQQLAAQQQQIQTLAAENEALRNKANEAPIVPSEDASGPPSGNLKQLQAKIKHFEKMLASLEKERSELRTRSTNAESQNKAMEGKMQILSQESSSKINQMKVLLKQKGVDVSKF